MQSFRTSTGLSQMQESGRFTHLLVTPIVRQAGYLPDPGGFGTTNSSQAQIDPTLIFTSSTRQNAVIGYRQFLPTGYPSSFDTSKIQSGTDVLAIAFAGQASAVSTSDTPLRTCLGAPVYADQIAVNVFYIRTPDAGVLSSLNCYSNVSTIGTGMGTGTSNDQPLISGVSNMQILYGIDARNDGTTVNGYYDADQVGALKTDTTDFTNPWISANTNASPWLAVRSIQIAFTVLSADAVESGLKKANPALLNIDPVTGRLTTTVTSTIGIRNRLHN
jgi:hypothetical protein